MKKTHTYDLGSVRYLLVTSPPTFEASPVCINALEEQMVEEVKEIIVRKKLTGIERKVQWVWSLNNVLEGASEWNKNPLRG